MDLERFPAAAEAYLALHRGETGNADYLKQFLKACMGAGPDDCPALYPEDRAGHERLDCGTALERLTELAPKAMLTPQGDRQVSFSEMLATEDPGAGIVALSLYTGAALGVLGEPTANTYSERLLLADSLLACNLDKPLTVEAMAKVGKPDKSFDELFHPTLRQNLFDAAWRATNAPD